ncbi:MAG: galactose mutarotase [Bacteroidia bacterium]|nr:galactose mutarotase [Bacteroidia bacterium]
MKYIKEEAFKGTIKGKATALYTLKNKNGLVAQITNFGAKIVSLYVPDHNGNFADIVLGYETIDGYIKGNPYFGAICGRYANRIANGKFIIDGKTCQLPINNGPNSLHGGPEGFNNQMFDAKGVVKTANGEAVEMVYLSKDGEMGYPGTLTLKVTYTFTNSNELRLDYEANTDKATHINICSHSFFNLAEESNGDILGHELRINADRFTPVNDVLIPTGELKAVAGTPMDFTKPTIVGKRIDNNFDQLDYGKGYDHNWVLNKNKAGELSLAAICYEPKSRRVMEVHTTQPGVQLYTGNWLDGSDIGKGGKAYGMRSALCLETQNFPDSPNKSNFPSTLLKSGEVYKHSCVHKFYVK